MIKLESKNKFEPKSFRLSVSHEKFVNSFLEAGITIDTETWQRKYSATEQSLAAAVFLGLDIDPEGDVKKEASQLAVSALGVNLFDKLMTEAEGKATAVVDEAARQVIAKESTLTLPQLYKIFAQYRPGLSLGDEPVQALLAKIDAAKLIETKLSTSENMEVQLEMGGVTLDISQDSYVSILVADLYERARTDRSVFDRAEDPTIISALASKIRSQLHMGLLTQRSSDVLEKIKIENKDSLPADILALLEMQHGVGFHGIGEEKFFVKMADGQVIEQTRMKECDGCAHGAEETIKNNAPEIPIAEMVQEFEARQKMPEVVTEMEREMPPIYPLYAIPYGYVPPMNMQTWSSEVTANKQGEKPTITNTNESQMRVKLTSKSIQESKHSPMMAAPEFHRSHTKIIAHQVVSRIVSAEKKPNAKASVQREIFSTQADASPVMQADTARSRQMITKLEVSHPKVVEQKYPVGRVRQTLTLDNRRTFAQPGKPEIPRDGGTSPMNLGGERVVASQLQTPIIQKDIPTGSRIAAAFRSTVDVHQVKVEKNKKIETKVRTEVKKEVRVAGAKEKQKIIVVNKKFNAVKNDGMSSTTTTPLPNMKVAKTQSTVAKKRKLLRSTMAMQLAWPSETKYLDVLDRMSARQMIYTALPLAS
jgi:hypothetical protein